MPKVVVIVLVILMQILIFAAGTEAATKRTGTTPRAGGQCPSGYPIKGNFTTYSGERCIYHLPGQRLYSKTKAERCYANEGEAVQDGCRRSKM